MLSRLRSRLSERTTEGEPIDLEAVRDQIEDLTRQNLADREPRRERELLHLRHLAATGIAQRAGKRRELVDPDFERLNGEGALPEVSAGELTPGVVRAAILSHGSLIVRGLVDRDDATRMAEEMDRAIDACQAAISGEEAETGYFEPFLVAEALEASRNVSMSTGTVLLADSPRFAFQLLSLYEQANLRELIAGYLNEDPALSADKTTLRKAAPSEPGGWHQDGKFLGDVNSLNLWVALSECGDTAPGLDVVPQRLDHIVEAGVGAGELEAITVPHELAEQLAGESGVQRPIFEPGDAMFFDHLFLHRTGAEPSMTNPRFAVESWFFGPSAFPEGYTALAF